MSTRWIEPTRLQHASLGTAEINCWRQAGYCCVQDLFSTALIQGLRQAADAHFPSAGSDAAQQYRSFGSRQGYVFPAAAADFNDLVLAPSLLQAVADLLGTSADQIRLTQADLWPKYGHGGSTGAYDSHDQRMHCDYPNHTLTHPPPWQAPEAVELIVYLDSVADCGGATAVVAREGDDDPAYRWPIIDTPGVAGLPYLNARSEAEAYLHTHAPAAAEFRQAHLYAREAQVRYQPGTTLLYRHDTWHRGTPLHDGSRRLAANLTFKLASSEWISVLHTGWAWALYRPEFADWFAGLSALQRTVLGFPPPGHTYWQAETLAAVAARYPSMDLTPYQILS